MDCNTYNVYNVYGVYNVYSVYSVYGAYSVYSVTTYAKPLLDLHLTPVYNLCLNLCLFFTARHYCSCTCCKIGTIFKCELISI